jgi:hypothetical protein
MTERERLLANGINIDGLNLADRNRIEEVGLEVWLAERPLPVTRHSLGYRQKQMLRRSRTAKSRPQAVDFY